MFGMAGSFRYGGSIDVTYDAVMMQLAFVLGFVGFGAKAAVFPLHDWLPTASVAPTPVTALLHAVAVVNSGVFAVMRMTYYVFGADYLRGTTAQAICLALAVFSLLFGAVQALRERHFKRRFAYSTMSNLSYMLLGVMTLSPQGLKAGLAHMVFHGVIKISLFMCAGAFMHQARRSYIYELNGIGRRMPATFTAYTTAGLGAATEAVQMRTAGSTVSQILPYLLYGGVAALIIAAFLCAMYTLSITVRAFFPLDEKDLYKDSNVREAGPLMLVPLYVFGVCNILFGMFPGPILAVLTAIGEGTL